MRATDASGLQILSSLEKAGAGAIIRQTLREDGFMVRQEITKLPRGLFNIAEPTIIPQERNVVQVVVNRSSRVFEPYEVHIGLTDSAEGSSNAQLPLVLERQEETIPTYTGTGSYSLENAISLCFVMAIDEVNAHPIAHQLRRDVTPDECYQCESAYQYVRQMQRNEKLCAGDAFYDLYSICAGCIEDSIDSGSPREYVEPNLGRYVDYCAQFTSLTRWATMGATSATSATLQTQSTTVASAEETDGGGTDDANITNSTVEQTETSVPVSGTNTIPQTTTEDTQSGGSASSSNAPKKDSSSSSNAWIAGAVVPSVLFLAVAVAFTIWWRKRRNRTQKGPKTFPVDGVAGTSGFDKPELDSQGIARPKSKTEAIMSASTAVHDTAVLQIFTEMPENGLNRVELHGEATGGTGQKSQNHGSGPYYELPATGATVYELPTKPYQT
ncbi:hypothetical protein FCIRC_8280 [Fusarium circinatum]|uniref:Uncharacterized protein n=1 Tax=Fusarium circinatum TaxID=48490 RepID=A0A8H5TMZ4_FUSCI|nr:hypothetical protein FCIRC_8280 [Fusarium circinatum]